MRTATDSESPWAGFGFDIALQVRHPRLSMDRLSQALRLRPGRTWVAGASRATPKGTPLKGIYKESYCFYKLAGGTGPDALEARLRAVSRKLSKHSRLLGSWRRSGGRLCYYVTVHGKVPMGFSLGPDLLLEIGRLGVGLGVEALEVRQRS